MADGPTVTVYGLSTEGYSIACRMAGGNATVYAVDESTSSSIRLEPEIAQSYPDAHSLREDEPLLTAESIQSAVSKSRYLFFAPTIRKTGHDVNAEIHSKFKDAVSALGSGSAVINNLPTGFGGSGDTIDLLEHITGLEAGKSISYYYYPLSGRRRPRVMGSYSGREDAVLGGLVAGDGQPPRFVDLASSEYFYGIDIISRFARVSSAIEVCRLSDDPLTRSCLSAVDLRDLYLDDMVNGMYDLRSLKLSLEGSGAISQLVKGSSRGIDGYIKWLIEEIKYVLRDNNLKASRTRMVLLWTLDQSSMRGDRIEMRQRLTTRLRDYVGDITMQSGSMDIFHSEMPTIVIACTKHDFESVHQMMPDSNLIVIKANPLYEVVM